MRPLAKSGTPIGPRPWLVLAFLLFGTATDAAEKAVPLKRWLEGPVRYIVTADEDREFRRLRQDPERAAFVERFWLRRDPTPETWVNEYRVLFWNRVREANERFTDSAFPGWKTDRGKIFVLHGPPTDIQEDPNADVSGSTKGGGRGLIRWTYQGRPGNRVDLDPVVVVPFVRDASGEYRLSYDPALSSFFFDWTRTADRNSPNTWDRWMARYPTSDKSELAVMLDLGKLQEVPPVEQVLLERVETYESFAQADLAVDLGFFEPPAVEGTLVIVTVALLARAATENEVVVVRFTPRDAAGAGPRVLGEGSFLIKPEGGRRLAQGRLALPPGTWDTLAVVVDPATGVNRVWRGAVTISARSTAFRASPLALAALLEPVPYASLVSYDVPFTVGGFRLDPLAGRSLERGEEISAFLEAYGGTPPYKATFRLAGREKDGRWTPLGKPESFVGPGPAIAWGLRTGPAWPAGEYRVTVDLEDATGTPLTREASLKIGAEEP